MAAPSNSAEALAPLFMSLTAGMCSANPLIAPGRLSWHFVVIALNWVIK